MLAFIHVAKTGGQTIETMLASAFGHRFCVAPDWGTLQAPADGEHSFVVPKYGPEDLKKLARICPWLRCVGGHSVTLWSGFDEVQPTIWFSMIREPLARGASHFHYNLRDTSVPSRPWDAWVEWPVHHNHQVKMFAQSGKAEDAIQAITERDVFVGLTEKFDESLVLLQNAILPDLNISYHRRNVARDKSVAQEVLVDPVKRDQMTDMYSEDLLLHEFVTKEWYPRFQKKFGPGLERAVSDFQVNRARRFSRWKYYQSRLNHHLILRPYGRLKGRS